MFPWGNFVQLGVGRDHFSQPGRGRPQSRCSMSLGEQDTCRPDRTAFGGLNMRDCYRISGTSRSCRSRSVECPEQCGGEDTSFESICIRQTRQTFISRRVLPYGCPRGLCNTSDPTLRERAS